MFNFLFQASLLASAKLTASTMLLGATTFLSNPGTAVKPMTFDASVYVTSNSKIKLAVVKTVPGLVSVSLTDTKNHSLFQQTLYKKTMKAAMQLDVSELPDGVYTLEIKSDQGSIVKQINLGTPKAERSIAMQ